MPVQTIKHFTRNYYSFRFLLNIEESDDVSGEFTKKETVHPV